MSYSGNKNDVYKSENEDVTNRAKWFTNPQYPYYKTITCKPFVVVSDKIIHKTDGEYDSITDKWVFKSLDKIKPWDLMYLENTDEDYLDEGTHIAMVLDVDINENMDLTNIKLIESTWDKDQTWAKVYNEYTLDSYKNKNWVIVRLKK